MTAEAVDEKVAIVVEPAGDRIEHIEMNIRTFFVNVTDDRTGTIDSIARMVGVEPAVLEASPFALVGTPSKIVEDLLALRETYGFSYVIVGVERRRLVRSGRRRTRRALAGDSSATTPDVVLWGAGMVSRGPWLGCRRSAADAGRRASRRGDSSSRGRAPQSSGPVRCPTTTSAR